MFVTRCYLGVKASCAAVRLIPAAGLRTDKTIRKNAEKIQEKVPKKLTPYIVYVKDNFQRVRSTSGADGKMSDVIKLVAQEFKALSLDDLKNYAEKAKKTAKANETALKTLTESERNTLKVARRLKAARSKRIEAGKELKRLKLAHGYPMASSSTISTAIFAKSQENSLKSLKPVDRSKKVGEMWRKLNETEKSKFKTEAAAVRSKLKADVENWEANMKRKNQEYVIIEVRRLQSLRRSQARVLTKLATEGIKPKRVVKKKVKGRKVALKTKPKLKIAAKNTSKSTLAAKKKKATTKKKTVK